MGRSNTVARNKTMRHLMAAGLMLALASWTTIAAGATGVIGVATDTSARGELQPVPEGP